MKRNLTYVFSICFILFFTFSTSATDCPPEKPFQDVRGNCYSCDDSRTFIKYPKSVKSGLEELEYNGNCTDVCPNRIEYRDGWLDAPYFCDKNTLKNKLNAYIVKNAMSILFNPINWINFFIICFYFPLFLLRIFKKDKNIALKIIIPIFDWQGIIKRRDCSRRHKLFD
jgi:hypothetical protein